MKHPDYDRAFHQTPDYIRSAIELGFMKGKRRMRARHRLASALTVAAVFVLLLGAGAYGVRRLAANRPDDRVGGAPLSAGKQFPGAPLCAGGQGEATPSPEPTVTKAPEATAAPTRSEAPAKGEAGAPESTPSPAEEAVVARTPEAPTPGVDPTPAPTPASELPLVYQNVRAAGGADPYYHLESDCGWGESLSGELDVATALQEGFTPCPDCVEGRGYRPLVFRADGTGDVAIRYALWYTDSGNYFHVDSNCSGMAGAQEHSIAETFASGKRSCPVCMENWACAVALDAPGIESALVDVLGDAQVESLPDGASIAVEPASAEDLPGGASIAVEPAPAMGVYEAVEAAPTAEVAPAAEAALDVVYYAEEGSYFHGKTDCSVLRSEEGGSFPAEGSGVSGAVVIGGSLMDALRAGKNVCPDCLSGWDFVVSAVPSNAEAGESAGEESREELAEAPEGGAMEIEAVPAESVGEEITAVYAAADEAGFYHRSDSCGGEALPRELSVEQALREGLNPCPDCLPEGACEPIAYFEADGSQVSTQGLWYTEGGRYFHSSMYCDGMWGAVVHPIADAFASGKEACPRCMTGWMIALRCAAEEPTPTPFALYQYSIDDGDGVDIRMTVNGGAIDATDAAESEEAEGSAEAEAEIADAPADSAPYDVSHRFYYTPNGQYYHMRSDCSGMTGAKRHSAAETAATGKRHCPVCIGDRIDYYWLPAPLEDGNYDVPKLYDAAKDAWMRVIWSDAGNVFVPLNADDGQPHYYHINPECFGMNGAKMIPWDEAKGNGLGPCPACLPVRNSGGSRTICYASGGDDLYHADPNCSGVRRARELTELAAQAEGKLRCPLCASDDAPAGWTEVRGELGASIAAAYPGWNFERFDEFEDRTEWFISDGNRAMCAAILRFAEEGKASEAPVRELTLEHGDTATRFFPQNFIESLPAPLSALQDLAHPESIFTLRLEYANGQLTSFTAGETIGKETAYTTWAIQSDGTAEQIIKN